MKKTMYLLFFLSIVACNTQSPKEKIENLNGYWAISKAETADGQIKEYTFNPMVDYIEIENNEGFRKKVQPKLDGSYFITDKEEQVRIEVQNDSIYLYYSTPMSQWMETLVSSEENEIVLINEFGNEYTYKRFTGYLDEDYGQEEEE